MRGRPGLSNFYCVLRFACGECLGTRPYFYFFLFLFFIFFLCKRQKCHNFMKQKNKRTKEKRESFTPAWVLDPRWTPSQVEPRALSQHGPWKIWPYFYCVLRCACGEAWERGLILLRVTLRVRGRPGKVNEARARSRSPQLFIYESADWSRGRIVVYYSALLNTTRFSSNPLKV